MESILKNYIIPEDFVEPVDFDARTAWPSCNANNPVQDRGDCASSWAISTTEAVSYRACAKGSYGTISLSHQYMVSCFFNQFFKGCKGGQTWRSYFSLIRDGIPDAQCYPYTSGVSGMEDTCQAGCPNAAGDPYKYQCEAQSLFLAMADDGGYMDSLIKWRLVTTGPMHMTLKVYPSWENYSSGIYVKES